MNTSQKKFSMTQDQLNNQEISTDFGFNPNSIINSSNLKGKLLGLEEKILETAKLINEEKRRAIKNGNTKDEVQDYLKNKNKEVSEKLAKELDNVQEEMNNHFTNQKSENAKLAISFCNLAFSDF